MMRFVEAYSAYQSIMDKAQQDGTRVPSCLPKGEPLCAQVFEAL